MDVKDLPLAGTKLIRPDVFPDRRGFFLESYNRDRYGSVGVGCFFVQDNHSRSVRGALRGLHYQEAPGQAKLVRVARGRIFDVVVDIRPSSSTFGRWHGSVLDDEEQAQLFIPVGFAHGFCVLSESADVVYKVSAPYDPAAERTLRWDDPELSISWPIRRPILSDRDRRAESFASLRGRVLA